jgi:hypothetical protein
MPTEMEGLQQRVTALEERFNVLIEHWSDFLQHMDESAECLGNTVRDHPEWGQE